MATILYVDDEPAIGMLLDDTLERAGHRPVGARSVQEALQVLARGGVDLIISDYKMPGLTGLEFLGLLQRDGHDVPLIMLTGYASIEHAVSAIKAGAIDYITKPVNPQQLELAVEQALGFVQLRRENTALKEEVMQLRQDHMILGDSPAIRTALQEVAMAAPTRATVLLLGESGVGKELFARAVHDQSVRRDAPFIKLNCAALPEGLIESALFGHEKGAFTGAHRRVEGAFERAHHGTLLLDEVTEMRLDLQSKLLRVLQEQEFERVGGETAIRVDTRIVATSNRDMQAAVAKGEFRQDLFYRLSVIPVVIPPLRERTGDIPLLAMRFAMRTAHEMGKEIHGIAPDALVWLQSQRWPGNVRELQHTVERAVILSHEPMLQRHTFESAAFAGTPPSSDIVALHPPVEGAPVAPAEGIVLDSLRIDVAERALISKALERTGGNRTRAAELLGIAIRTLRSKLNSPDQTATADQG